MVDYDLKGKKILVTGATGFIGGQVTKRLLKEGMQVRAMARTPAKAGFLAGRGAEVVYGDMTDAASLRNAVQGCQFVFHFAAAMRRGFQPDSYYRAVNVEGTRILAEAALDANVERFIHTSSVWVFGLDAVQNTSENSLRHPSREFYCDTKLEGENVIRALIKERSLPAVIIYPTVVYGPYDDNCTMQSIKVIQQGKMILASGGTGIWNTIFIDDLVDGILAAARHGVIGEGYILGGPENVTLREFEENLARIAGRERLASLPAWLTMTIATLAEWEANIFHHPPFATREYVRGMIMHATYNLNKAKRDLGFEAHTDLSTGMHRVQEWLVHTGRISPTSVSM